MIFTRRAGTKRIDQKVAKEIMDAREVVLVDVRTPGEYAQGYIEGAVLLPLSQIRTDAEKILPDKEAEIFVYCLSGSRSRTAVSRLSKAGYSNATDIGGIMTWPYGLTGS